MSSSTRLSGHQTRSAACGKAETELAEEGRGTPAKGKGVGGRSKDRSVRPREKGDGTWRWLDADGRRDGVNLASRQEGD